MTTSDIQSYNLNMTGITRNIMPLADKLLSEFPAISILGPRQYGKTTLSRQLRQNWLYLDLENPRDFDRLSYDPLLFFNQHPNYVIIDEAQLYPELFPILRGVIDNNRNLKGRFILTGSSSPELLTKITESLAGRIGNIELTPFKANERYQVPLSNLYACFRGNNISNFEFKSLQSNLTLEQIRTHWLYGGYPEITVNNNLDFWQNWMYQYRDSYLNRDIAKLFPRLNTVAYRRFLQILSKLSGTIVNKSDLARNLEVSQPSIHDYLSIAAGTFIWRNLLSYEDNITKSVIKMPKGFIRDTGLLHYLLKISDLETLNSDPIVGNSFEGFVIEEIMRGLQAQGIYNVDSYFYRTKNGAEVDLILHGYFGIVPIEIKYGSYTPMKNLRALQNFITEHKLPLGIVINQADTITYLTPNIIQIPANYL